jgi:ankyrin
MADSGLLPLHQAASEGHSVVCSALLETECVISTCDADGWTAMHWAAYNRHWETLFLLLSPPWNGNVNAQSRLGETVLHYAARW